MKKKKVVILSLIILLILILSLVLIFNKNIFKKLKGDASDEFYNRTGFKSEEVYQCVIDEYNTRNKTSKTINDTLSDSEINSLSGTFRIRKTINCYLSEEAENETIDLTGIDKFNYASFKIHGTADKVVATDLNIDKPLYIDLEINANKYEIYNNKLLSLSIFSDYESNDSTYKVTDVEIYNNRFVGFFDDWWSTAYATEINMSNVKNTKIYNNDFESSSLNLFNNIDSLLIDNNIGYIDIYCYDDPKFSNLTIKNSELYGFYCHGSTIENLMFENVNFEEIENNSFSESKYGNIIMNNTNLAKIDFSYSQFKNIELLNNNELETIDLSNSSLEELDVSNTINLKTIDLSNNQIHSIDLSKNINLANLNISNNQLTNIDLSKNTNLRSIVLENNNFGDNFKYIVKGKEYNVKDVINLPGNTSYSLGDTLNIIKIENDILTGEKDGYSSFRISNIKLDPSLKFNLNVYDITSSEYTMDKDKKEIVYKKDFDIRKITLTDGYTVSLNEDELIIKYDEDFVDTYKIVKEKEVTTTKKTDSKTTTKKNESKEDSTNKKESNNTIKNNNVVTTEVRNKDIYLNSNVIPSNTLKNVKGYNRNIIIENKDITLKVNGLNIKDASNSIDLNYIFIDLREYGKKDELKDISNGYILKFKTKKELPVKVMVEVPYNNIKEKVDNKDIKVYSYNDNNYELVYKNNALNNKINFYINKLGTYVITNDEVQKVNKSEVYTDNVNLYVTNNKIVHNKNIYKRSVIILIFIIIDTILLLLFLIGTKNNKNKTSIGGDNK